MSNLTFFIRCFELGSRGIANTSVSRYFRCVVQASLRILLGARFAEACTHDAAGGGYVHALQKRALTAGGGYVHALQKRALKTHIASLLPSCELNHRAIGQNQRRIAARNVQVQRPPIAFANLLCWQLVDRA